MIDQLTNSELAARINVATFDPSHHGLNFIMSTKLSDSFESQISGLGERKVFTYLNVKRMGFPHGWIGSVSAPDLAEYFTNTRKKTSAQHYSRLISSLREKKMVFQIWFNTNRTLKVHWNLTWICIDPAQWDDIFPGCPIYPITLGRFIESRASLVGSLRNEFKLINIDKPVYLKDWAGREMIKAIFAQFKPRMHKDIQENFPTYDTKTDPEDFLILLDSFVKKWPAYYGIDDIKIKSSENISKEIRFFISKNENTDFEDHIFGNETQLSSGVQDSTLDTETNDLSSVQDSTLDSLSGVQDSTLDSLIFCDVITSNTNDLQAPSCARILKLDKKESKEDKKEKIEEKKEGDSSSDGESKKSKSKKCISLEVTKKRSSKMNLNDNVIINSGEGSLRKQKKASPLKKKIITPKNSFDLGSKRVYSILTPTGLYSALQDEMFNKHRFKFNGRFEVNSKNPVFASTMDKIKESGYLDEEILKEWISWYSGVYMTHERLEKNSSKFVSSFTDTWKMFSRTISRPEERDALRREIMAHKISEIPSESEMISHLERIMQKTKTDSEAIKTMLLQFGVVVVGNWLEKGLKRTDAQSSILEVLDSMGKMQLMHVYGMTTMRESGFIKSGAVRFFDWRKLFEGPFNGIEDDDDMEPVDYECDEVDRFLAELTR